MYCVPIWEKEDYDPVQGHLLSYTRNKKQALACSFILFPSFPLTFRVSFRLVWFHPPQLSILESSDEEATKLIDRSPRVFAQINIFTG